MNIKKIYTVSIYILISVIIITLFACEKYKDDRYDFSNTQNPYVLFSGTDKIQTYEGWDSVINITMELPISLAEDIIVTYQVSGDAIENQDYIMSNSQESVIEFSVFITNPDTGAIRIIPLDDIAEDGDKTLVIKLVSAYTDSSNRFLDIGLGNEGATFTVFLDDDDCPTSLEGEFESYSIWYSDTSYKDITITYLDTNLYIISDITAGAFDYLSPPNVPIQANTKFACGDIVCKDIKNEHDILSFVDIKGEEVIPDTSFTLEWIYIDDLGYPYDKGTTYFSRK